MTSLSDLGLGIRQFSLFLGQLSLSQSPLIAIRNRNASNPTVPEQVLVPPEPTQKEPNQDELQLLNGTDPNVNTNEDDDEDYGEEDEDEKSVDPLEPVRGEVRCVPSLFPHRVPGIYFDYPSTLRTLGITRDNQGAGSDFYVEELGGRKIFYKCNWERNCIKNAFNRAGFRRKISGVQWNCQWGKHLTTDGFESLNRFQKANHFPGSWCIGRKDRLMRCIGRAKRAAKNMPNVPSDGFDIIPGGWILPTEYDSFTRAASMERNPVYILKPSASACGRGIRLIHKNNMNSVPKVNPCIVQEYLKDPYLINGKKFDLRIYVLVTSFDPLRCYVFQEGLARFSTKNYSMKNLNSRYAHLTNYSINKKSKNFVAPTADNNSDMEGSKWSLTALWRYLSQTVGLQRVKKCQREVRRLITKTLIAAEGEVAPLVHRHVKHSTSCYEVFGFDVFLDKVLRPWLIEVNISPSLMGSSPLDQKIKGTLMADVFHLIGNVPYDEKALKSDKIIEKMQRRAGSFKSRKAVSSNRVNQDLWRKNPTHPGTVNMHDLTEDDWEKIYDLEDEHSRKGHFTRLFPSEENNDLLQYFQSPRFNNACGVAWLEYWRASYCKNWNILEEAGKDEEDRQNAFDLLIKHAQKKNKQNVGNGPAAGKTRPRSQYDRDTELAPPIVLVPGYNCAEPRCKLSLVQEDDSSSWLIPLGARSKEQVKLEMETLAACFSGAVEDDEITTMTVDDTVDTGSLESGSSGSNVENSRKGENEESEGGKKKKKKKKSSAGKEGGGRILLAKRVSVSAAGGRERKNSLTPQENPNSNTNSNTNTNDAQRPQYPKAKVGRIPLPPKPMSAGMDGVMSARAQTTRSAEKRRNKERPSAQARRSQQQQQQQQTSKERREEIDIFADAKLLIQQHLSQVGVGGRDIPVSTLNNSIFMAQKQYNYQMESKPRAKAGD
ncbi:hypothetical protein TL16_g00962 [Triparma laevis f. inornata]|uniref:Tubulin--tyrosine ligase-like protein 5 n=1 Tax=Triparma laevis f. inornata TaxID=1714386 RepID=A0A9W7DUI4_9STRA|nr:hypothetical protein TL16_g00962 [Triparma laevis f. inornata]